MLDEGKTVESKVGVFLLAVRSNYMYYSALLKTPMCDSPLGKHEYRQARVMPEGAWEKRVPSLDKS